jgi:hypothetical protein
MIGFAKLVQLRVILKPAKPVIRPATVRSNNQDFNISTHLPVNNIVRKTGNPITPDIGWKFDLIAMRSLTNLDHCGIEGSKITRSKTGLSRLVKGDVLKVLDSCGRVEKVTHLRSA